MILYGEDIEFSFSIRKDGYKILYNDKAIAYHKSHDSFKRTVKRAFRYGRGTSVLAKLHPSKTFISPALIARVGIINTFLLLPFPALITKDFKPLLFPLFYFLISTYFFFNSCYIRQVIYEEGLLFSILLAFFRNLMVWIYLLGIIYGNIENKNFLVADLIPKYMVRNASKGLAVTSFLNDLYPYLLFFLIFYI